MRTADSELVQDSPLLLACVCRRCTTSAAATLRDLQQAVQAAQTSDVLTLVRNRAP
jgi:hypothetical protein